MHDTLHNILYGAEGHFNALASSISYYYITIVNTNGKTRVSYRKSIHISSKRHSLASNYTAMSILYKIYNNKQRSGCSQLNYTLFVHDICWW